MIRPIIYNGESATELFGAREQLNTSVESTVKGIIDDVRLRGDAAVCEYAKRFDGYDILSNGFTVAEKEFDAAVASLSDEYISMLERAAANIRAFHAKQKRSGFELKSNGRTVGQKVVPISTVAIYVPGGTAAYPSTVLMNAIPAKIAGVPNLLMATPVKSDGKIKPEVLAAARICGVDKVYKVGGAQAVAALAYGTESIPKADKITGPGNAYVAEAKRQVSGVACGIDMLAGPSEILVVADGKANPENVAADMLSQAEHDKLASALLICTDPAIANEVIKKLYARAEELPRKEIALCSIENRCKVIVAPDLDTALALSDEYAPEHLELCVSEPFAALEKIKNAGSVFLGYNTPEAVGDYYAGANHTLPTSGTARFSSPLGVDDFVKTTQYIYYDKSALDASSSDIIMFAESEGLSAHAKSVSVRTDKGGKK